VSFDDEHPGGVAQPQKTIHDLENLYDHAVGAMADHLKDGGEPVLDRDGELVGRKLNPQIVRAALSEAERLDIKPVIRPGTRADRLLRGLKEDLEIDFEREVH